MPEVMSHAPLPDCRVKGLHYCHSRYKPAPRHQCSICYIWYDDSSAAKREAHFRSRKHMAARGYVGW